ncbi:putative G-protein coupled receptor B0563.6 [Tubulanus polymorphus]|uniref:putative G-protein coupled receptor B0563.6 n=1 Tax=Tubulanus polymorphus TaxID=672921 RepID=UPI003DA274C0
MNRRLNSSTGAHGGLQIGKPFFASILLNILPVQAQKEPFLRMFALISLPTIYGVGLLGNLCSLFTMMSARFRGHSYANYLAALALADLGCSQVFFIPIPNYILGYPYITIKHDWCAIYTYVLNIPFYLGSYLVVFIALERLILVLKPFTARILCTAKFARINTLCLTLASMAIPSYSLFIVKYEDHLGCYVSRLHQRIHFLFSVIMKYYIPAILIIIFNIIIIANLQKQKDFGSGEMKSAQTMRITMMLLSVSAMFTATTFPPAISSTFTSLMKERPKYINRLNAITNLMQNSNYATNFYLYLLTGKEIRAHLFDKLRSCCRTR